MLAVNQGGNHSSFFNIGRGCRQGDLLPPSIFILCAEDLAIKIRNNNNIKGITINDNEFKLSQYADDTSLLLDGSDTSLNAALSELSNYARYSGLNINFDKTHVIWIGKKKFSSDTIKTKWKLVWGKCQFKLLGLNFHVDLDKMIDINFKDKIKVLENKIKLWKRRFLSPLGKITVIKSLLIPLLTHLFISLPNPDATIITQINKIFFDFLWDGPAKIKKTVVVKNYSEGGLKMINLSAFVDSLKLTWLRRLLRDNGKWQLLTQNKFDLNKLITCGEHFCEGTITTLLNKFWKDVLNAYLNLLKMYEPKRVL